MSEAGSDLAGVDEMSVRARQITGLEDAEHPQPVLEVALLDAVDVRLFEKPGAAIDPAPAAAPVSFEPETLGQLPSEDRRPVHGAIGQTDLVGSHPTGEAVLVVTSQVGRRGRPIEIVDVETLGIER